ncbi:A-kinase anchor protein 12, partial [Frankliniella fusca]
ASAGALGLGVLGLAQQGLAQGTPTASLPINCTAEDCDVISGSVASLDWYGNETWLQNNATGNATLAEGDVYFMAAISVLLGIMILITIIDGTERVTRITEGLVRVRAP